MYKLTTCVIPFLQRFQGKFGSSWMLGMYSMRISVRVKRIAFPFYTSVLPLKRFSASRYSADVFRTTSSGSFGAGGFLLKLIESR